VTGEIESGQIYPIAHFSSKLGVSATPIREALFDLAGAGIVEIVRNRGFRVPALTDRDLDEIQDLRLLLERTAVVRVAENEGLPNARKLRRLAAEILAHAQKRDIHGFLSADRHFHGELIRRSDNKRLASIVTDLRDQQRLYGLPLLAESGRLLASAREHTDILAAIERRDGAKVYRLMTQHLLHTRGAWAGLEEAAFGSDESSKGTIG
jgi:DNA-binding GntR family transcriptional regulator